MKNRMWILGAPDPEMERIEALLRECGEAVVHAAVDGKRVHGGNAYKADGLVGHDALNVEEVVLVECGLTHHEGVAKMTSVDHHKEGDPGYGKPPEEFLEASSLGQVIAILAKEEKLPAWKGVKPEEGVPQVVTTDDINGQMVFNLPMFHRLAAAADHCLGAAYRGECPGVEPDKLGQWRAYTRAAFQKRPVGEVMVDVANARKALMAAPLVALAPECFGVRRVRDMRGKHAPELPEAAAREGSAFMAEIKDREGRTKVVLQAARPEQIRAFMEVYALEEGLTGVYGDGARGFAGGYVSEGGEESS